MGNRQRPSALTAKKGYVIVTLRRCSSVAEQRFRKPPVVGSSPTTGSLSTRGRAGRPVTQMWRRPNGLTVGRMRVPLGVIGIIYESRPNVTADAAGLCLKSGNAVILRGGREALRTNRAIASVRDDVSSPCPYFRACPCSTEHSGNIWQRTYPRYWAECRRVRIPLLPGIP